MRDILGLNKDFQLHCFHAVKWKEVNWFTDSNYNYKMDISICLSYIISKSMSKNKSLFFPLRNVLSSFKAAMKTLEKVRIIYHYFLFLSFALINKSCDQLSIPTFLVSTKYKSCSFSGKTIAQETRLKLPGNSVSNWQCYIL